MTIAIAIIEKVDPTKTYAVEFFKNKFYHGAIADAYPIDAMLLNTNIMVSLIEREFLSPN